MIVYNPAILNPAVDSLLPVSIDSGADLFSDSYLLTSFYTESRT